MLAVDDAYAVLVKGGHADGTAYDVMALPNGTLHRFEAARVETKNTHGTGCTLSSAIACGLAQGFDLEDAVAQAKAYVGGALSAGLDLGRGSGPLDHMWRYR
jgi:hydroxymethylpyrimidine/phosphomethylpyrimidine kinase